MNTKPWIRKALTACLSVAVFATSSMVALAGAGRAAAELQVSGPAAAGEAPFVFVNGEASRSGRAVFSSSLIATPETATAVLNMGKIGTIEIAPNSSVSLSFDDKGVNADLTSGKVMVLGSAAGVNVKTADGVVRLVAGESATATGKAQTSTHSGGGAAWWAFAAVMAGAAVVIIWAATNGNESNLGGNAVVTSPSR